MYCGSVLACPLQIMVVRGHGRGVCAVVFVACVAGDECSTCNVVLGC